CCSDGAAGIRPRAPTAGSRGNATLSAASPLLRCLVDPHYQATGHFTAGASTLEDSDKLSKEPGRRSEEDPRLGFRGRKASWREPERSCTSR
ncbi:Hypothetical predicted protein, partial [Marmota monax]